MQDMVSKSGVKQKSKLPTSGDLQYQRFVSKKDGLEFIYAEVYMPYWSKSLFNKDITIEQLQEAGLDVMIGYRIPTENKNSIFIFKVKEFLDPSQGSTIVVPPEFITQTGADFDIDTIYTMHYNFEIRPDNTISKIQYTTSKETQYQRFLDYVLENASRTSKLKETEKLRQQANTT